MIRRILVTLFSFVAVSAPAPPAPYVQPKQSIRVIGKSAEGFPLIQPLAQPLIGLEVTLGPPLVDGSLMINCQPDQMMTADGLRPVLHCPNPDRTLIIRGILWQK